MSESEFEHNIDERLDALDDKATDLVQECQYRSAMRVAGEIRRLAKAEQRLLSYIHGTFVLMNYGSKILKPQAARDAAIELISLLESEDRARALQPELPEAEYEYVVSRMTACAYDNLAKAMGELNGYNSDGVHACIADGIQVCRRTGKMECVRCFREYATDVYRASDDLEMAKHFARMGVAHEDPGPHDRRWVGAKDLCRLMLLTGQLDAAADAADQMWKLVETWHTPRDARLETALYLRELSCLLGDAERWPQISPPAPEANVAADNQLAAPPHGEFTWHELFRDQVDAVAACCANDYDDAIKLLSRWDSALTRAGCLREWFENRLRLLAAHRMAGNTRELERLGDQLVTKANAARDWLTIRLLERLRNPAVRPTPVPMVGDVATGPFATPTVADGPVAAAVTADSSDRDSTKTSEESQSTTPATTAPPEIVSDFWRRIMAAQEDSDEADDKRQAEIAAVLGDLLAISPPTVTAVVDAEWLLHTARYVIGDGSRGHDVWQWATSLAASRMQEAAVLNLLATLGATLRFGPSDALRELVSEDQLETWFRESLDLDPHRARNFERAGTYFRFMKNLGEAERCFARGFRLDRKQPGLAGPLADLYVRTDRPRDALAVLDMCLREGCDDAGIYWDAALTAFELEKHESVLLYLDGYEGLVSDAPWVNHYRAASLLALDRHAEALAAADEEARRNHECPIAVVVHRAAATVGLGQFELFQQRLADVLKMPLCEDDTLTPAGLADLFQRLWVAARKVEYDETGLQDLVTRVISAGIAPNEVFESVRTAGDTVEGVGVFECDVYQPLDERWADCCGRLADESDWVGYRVSWGVLARSQEEAEEITLSWQSRAYPLPAEVTETRMRSQGYNTATGVLWQGYRDGVTADEQDLPDDS